MCTRNHESSVKIECGYVKREENNTSHVKLGKQWVDTGGATRNTQW